MSLKEQYREFLFQAANSALGIELSSSDLLNDLQKLAQARVGQDALKHVQIRRVNGSDELIWLVPTAMDGEEEIQV